VFAEEPAEKLPADWASERDRHAACRGFHGRGAGRTGYAGGCADQGLPVRGNHSHAVNLPALSADQYRRVRPYLELAERLGSLVSQAAASRPARIRIRYAGEVAEVGTHLLRSAVLAGVLNAVLEREGERRQCTRSGCGKRLTVEEQTRRREHGFPNTLEVSACRKKTGSAPGFTAEGTVLHDGFAPGAADRRNSAGGAIGRHHPLFEEPR